MQWYQPWPKNVSYSNTYNPWWRNRPIFLWKEKTNPSYAQNKMHGPNLNQNMSHYPPNKKTIEYNLKSFIKVCMDNHMKNNRRLDFLEASMKMVEVQVGKLPNRIQRWEKVKLPNQPKQMNAIIHQSGMVFNNNYFPKISNDYYLM